MKKFSNTVLILGIIFLYIPLIILVIFSFSDSEIINTWGGFTTSWYSELFQDADIVNSAMTSLKVATITAISSGVLGTMIAYAITRFQYFRTRKLLYSVVFMPLVLPGIILGLALLLMFTNLQHLIGWSAERGIFAIAIAHVTLCTAYVVIIMQSRIASVDISLEEAALDLGASPTKTFFQIILPQILPSIITSALLCFILSIDDLVVTEFVAGSNSPTLPMYIYSTVKHGPTPEINALATLIILAIIVCIFLGVIASLGMNKKNKF